MKRKAVVVVLAICVLLMTAACSNAAEPSWEEETKHYKNNELNFEFLYPDSWLLLDEETVQEVYDYVKDLDFGNVNVNDLLGQIQSRKFIYLIDKDFNSDGSTANINFNIIDKEKGLTLEILKLNSGALFEIMESYGFEITKTDDGTIKSFGPNKAFCIEYKCKILDLEFEYFQAYILGKTKSCILTFATTEDLSENKQIAEEILKFVKIG